MPVRRIVVRAGVLGPQAERMYPLYLACLTAGQIRARPIEPGLGEMLDSGSRASYGPTLDLLLEVCDYQC